MLLGYMINWQQLYQDLMNDLNLLAQLNFILGPALLRYFVQVGTFRPFARILL